MKWGDKRYNNLNTYLRSIFDTKVFKLSLDGGFTCPNRDGKLSKKGCIFCSEQGSGEFAGNREVSILKQLEEQKRLYEKKWKNGKYIAYFQNFTGTYASNKYLKEKYNEALSGEGVVGLAIATRPDCVTEENIKLLSEFNKKTFMWVELGLQTSNDEKGKILNRGYDQKRFQEAVDLLNKYDIKVVVHLIIGLPDESKKDFLNSVEYISNQNIFGVKFHMLQILKDTGLEKYYENNKFNILTREEYIDYIISGIEILNPNIVIHRLTGDPQKEMLIEPNWVKNKRWVLNSIDKKLKEKDSWQGKDEFNKYYQKR